VLGLGLAALVFTSTIAGAAQFASHEPAPFSLGTAMPPGVDSDVIQMKLNWEPSKFAVRYSVELSENAKFETLLVTRLTTSNAVIISDLPAGKKLFWRVWAGVADGRRMLNRGGAGTFTVPRTPPVYRPIVIPRSSPTVDGTARAGEWDKAPVIELETFALGAAQPADPVPACRMMWDDTSLYILCETGTPGLRAVSPGDGLEVFLQESGDESYTSFAANLRGDKLQGKSKDTAWKCEWQAASTASETNLGIEIALPWSCLSKKAPKPGDTWRGNLTADFGGWRGAVVRSWSKVYFTIEDTKAYHAFVLGK
jgi:hypothetical protein